MANPMNPVFIQQILAERPTQTQILGPRIGERWFPLEAQESYEYAWEVVSEYTPMAGLYDFQDKADTLGELPSSRFITDIMHWGGRETINPKDAMWTRAEFDGPMGNINYGTGPFAESAQQRDARMIAKKVRLMNEAIINGLEYVRIQLMNGRIIWPPRQSNGTVIAEADLPRQFGQMEVDFDVDMLAADAVTLDCGFEQAATTLVGKAGRAGTQVAWDQAGADAIVDLSRITDLMAHRKSIDSSNLVMLMARAILVEVSEQTTVLDRILGTSRDRQMVTISETREAVLTLFDLAVEFYQSKWQYVNKSDWGKPRNEITIHSIPFMNEGTVLLLPNGPLGQLITAPAPGPAYSWDTNLYYWYHEDLTPPWMRELGLGMWAWPIMLETDRHFIFKSRS